MNGSSFNLVRLPRVASERSGRFIGLSLAFGRRCGTLFAAGFVGFYSRRYWIM